jgi:hypothetical protein
MQSGHQFEYEVVLDSQYYRRRSIRTSLLDDLIIVLVIV